MEKRTIETEARVYRYDFGFITRSQARRTFKCNVLTGLVSKATLEKQFAKDKNGIGKSFYYVMTTQNYVYLVANDVQDAKRKFEQIFKEKDEQYKKLLAEKKAKQLEEK